MEFGTFAKTSNSILSALVLTLLGIGVGTALHPRKDFTSTYQVLGSEPDLQACSSLALMSSGDLSVLLHPR